MRAAPNAAKPCHAAFPIISAAAGEIWVPNSKIWRPGGRCEAGCAGTLPVGCLTLLHGRENVLGVVKVVLVESIVLHGGAMQPGGSSCFDEHATTYRYAALIVATVKIVLCITVSIISTILGN